MSNCACDRLEFPRPLAIGPSRSALARQIATFPEYRQALLAALPSYVPLKEWRARDNADFGLMLLEMWAALADMVSFYDEVIANELFLRTARRRPSLRRLTGLLGYVPRPASSAGVVLAAIADGKVAVAVPPHAGFRSGAFAGHPPQVFETEHAATIHPAFNSWRLRTVTPSTFDGGAASQHVLLARSGTVAAKNGDAVLLVAGSFARLLRVENVESYTGVDGRPYSKIAFTTAIGIPAGTPVAAVRLLKPVAKAGLWKRGTLSPYGQSRGRSNLRLDSLVRQIHAREYVLVGRGADVRWSFVRTITESDTTIVDATTTNITDVNGNVVNKVVAPAVTIPVTRLFLDTLVTSASRSIPGQAAEWSTADKDVDVHYAMIDAAHVVLEGKGTVAATDPLAIDGRPFLPDGVNAPGGFLLEDGDGRGVSIAGSLDFTNGHFALAQGSAWTGELRTPVTVYGNLLSANQGETVENELLGRGDASQPRQTFTLKKHPLSYVPSASAGNVTGVASTLSIWVDGVRWREVPSFFGVDAAAPVFIVRQGDDGNTKVTLQRLRTGAAVVASYRFGAGEASPPAGGISQVARAIAGLRSVRNPVAAAGGSDAEDAGHLSEYAPRSALLLGRAISVPDLEAAAAIQPGVRAASAEWRWNTDAQMPVVQIYYIGAPALQPQIAQTIRNLTDGVTPVRVDAAIALVRRLWIDLLIDERYETTRVRADVRAVLLAAKQGLLTPERLGVNRPLFRSVIFEAVLGIDGVRAVRTLALSGLNPLRYGVQPGAGRYFDFESGGVAVNGHTE
ncbi:MAG: hypothetical protein DMF87_27075 [Acidobacteria bacterium]|nr:MAG: hypothetical protein DMF87_27075 [Acidobacteriota bacterium]